MINEYASSFENPRLFKEGKERTWMNEYEPIHWQIEVNDLLTGLETNPVQTFNNFFNNFALRLPNKDKKTVTQWQAKQFRDLTGRDIYSKPYGESKGSSEFSKAKREMSPAQLEAFLADCIQETCPNPEKVREMVGTYRESRNGLPKEFYRDFGKALLPVYLSARAVLTQHDIWQ